MIYLAPTAEQPDARFLANAGCVLLTHDPDAETLALALRLLHRAAAAHDALAESVVGWCHLFGRHLPLDEVLALRHLRRRRRRTFPMDSSGMGCACAKVAARLPIPSPVVPLIERAAAAGHYEAAEWLSESAQPTN